VDADHITLPCVAVDLASVMALQDRSMAGFGKELSFGKGEVDSSILSGSTIITEHALNPGNNKK
jgi:hypothetical protein